MDTMSRISTEGHSATPAGRCAEEVGTERTGLPTQFGATTAVLVFAEFVKGAQNRGCRPYRPKDTERAMMCLQIVKPVSLDTLGLR